MKFEIELFKQDKAGETGGASNGLVTVNPRNMSPEELSHLLETEYSGNLNQAPEDVRVAVVLFALNESLGVAAADMAAKQK